MEDNDKKPSTVQKVVENLTHPTVSSGSTYVVEAGSFVAGSNIREVDFKKNPDDIVQTLGADTDAILITFERDKGELKLYHNGIEIDKAVFAKILKAETGFFALFDYIQDKFKSWKTAWM
jgi:hypothetical protein|tara:strand:- start:337 stop:696 length:360 start_codon:yes stop_codon:yes gene_type:complete